MNSVIKKSSWKLTKKKIAICSPVRDHVDSAFAYSLAELVKVSTKAGLDVFHFFEYGSVLLNQREKLVKRAHEIEAEYILWLDSDMHFPPTLLLQLLKHDKDIVACNYMNRVEPFKSVAFTDVTDWESWIAIKPHSDLQEVQAVGLGVCLMRTELFSELDRPYFEFKWHARDENFLGEDFLLFHKLRNIGYKVWIDSTLSMDVKHIGQFAFGDNLRANRYKK